VQNKETVKTALDASAVVTRAIVQQEFERALGAIQARVSTFASTFNPEDNTATLAIAYSGGLDSTVLLHLAHAYAQQRQIPLLAFHVHHGLSPHADAWLAHCRAQCMKLGIAFDARNVEIAAREKNGIEEAARLKRYAALGAMCRAHHAPLLLTAHHQDDQAETVLLQLLRGSGVAGLSGMDSVNHAADLLGDATLLMGRPLLQLTRAQLESWCSQNGLAFVEDESNRDPRYARNALRHQIMPMLEQCFPGFQRRFSRTAQHAQSAQQLLITLAAQDLATCLDGECLSVAKLQSFGDARIDNMLRYWFGLRGVRMPSTSWLQEVRAQLLQARHDAQVCVTHADCHIRRHRDRVFITSRDDGVGQAVEAQTFQWDGSPSVHFARFGGTLYFDAAASGLDAADLRRHMLTLCLRSGGERLKLAPNRPTKSLKYHYQACDVPAWERLRLPLLFNGKTLLFAAGIGMDCHALLDTASAEKSDVPRISLRWEFDRADAL
jgi:tRNA(Ile)-lysidine synthase